MRKFFTLTAELSRSDEAPNDLELPHRIKSKFASRSFGALTASSKSSGDRIGWRFTSSITAPAWTRRGRRDCPVQPRGRPRLPTLIRGANGAPYPGKSRLRLKPQLFTSRSSRSTCCKRLGISPIVHREGSFSTISDNDHIGALTHRCSGDDSRQFMRFLDGHADQQSIYPADCFAAQMRRSI